MPTQAPVSRPRGVTIFAGFKAASGAIALILGAGGIAAASGGAHVLGPVGPYLPAIGAALLFFGALSLVLGFGLLRGLTWAWGITLAAEALHALGDVSFMAFRGFNADKLIGVAFAALLVYYLTRPGVRAYFRSAHAAA